MLMVPRGATPFYLTLLISNTVRIYFMAKKRTTKKELSVDSALDDLESIELSDEAVVEKPSTPSPESPESFSFGEKTKAKSKKKREELKQKFNAANRNDTLGEMMKGMQQAARSRFNSQSVFASSKEMSQIVVGIPMPALSLEYCLGNDVWPLSSLIQIAGKWGSCKSTLAYEIFRWFYEFGGRSILLDTESKYNPELARNVMRSGSDGNAMLYNRCESLEDWQSRMQWYVDEFKRLMEGTASDPGPGRVFPVCIGLDSVKAATSVREQEKVRKAGHADLGYATEANFNGKFLTNWKKNIDYFPFSVILVNHLKEKQDDMGNTREYTPGGDLISFLETIELRTSVWSRKISNSQFEGIGIRISCAKNSLAPTHRSIRSRFLWWSELNEETQELESYHTWDWNWSTVDLLHQVDTKLKGPEKSMLKALGWKLNTKSPSADVGAMANVPMLGMGKDDWLPWQEVGQMIHENEEVMNLLRKGLGIKRRRAMSLGEDYGEMLDEEKSKMR